MEIQLDHVVSYHERNNSENAMTFHDLAVDPLQVLTREGQGLLRQYVICQCFGHHIHPDFRIVEDLLRNGVLNSSESNLGLW